MQSKDTIFTNFKKRKFNTVHRIGTIYTELQPLKTGTKMEICRPTQIQHNLHMFYKVGMYSYLVFIF